LKQNIDLQDEDTRQSLKKKRKGKERKGKERKGKERKGKERKLTLAVLRKIADCTVLPYLHRQNAATRTDWWRLQQNGSPVTAKTIRTRRKFLNGWED